MVKPYVHQEITRLHKEILTTFISLNSIGYRCDFSKLYFCRPRNVRGEKKKKNERRKKTRYPKS